MILYNAPDTVDFSYKYKTWLFLGGSIEMGLAEKWQDKVIKDLSDTNTVIFNPRRDDWDSSWVQDPTPGTKFHEQVAWELNCQDNADILVYYFDDNTKSPITLLELGLYATRKHVFVRCTEKFWRYGNVKMVCDRYEIPIFDKYEDLIVSIKSTIRRREMY